LDKFIQFKNTKDAVDDVVPVFSPDSRSARLLHQPGELGVYESLSQ
jgi:hypothetical protein